MKTIIKIFTVVLAAVPVLVSCYSEPLPEVIPEVIPEDGGNGSEQDDKVHVISVSFDTKATRTVLGNDGITPHFVANDEIRVSDGTHEDTFIVYEKNDNYFIDVSPEFTGELTAVYPAKYSRVVDGKLTYFVPSDQTGEFKDANICMATFDVESKSATFYNKTAIFVIDVPEGTQYLEVTSLRAINPITGQRYLMNDEVSDEKYYYSAICDCMWDYDNSEDTIVDYSVYEADDDGSVEKGRFITIGDCSYPIPRTCYVSMQVNDNVLLCDLNFDAQYSFDSSYDGLAGTMGGFSPFFLDGKFGTGSADTKKVQKGAIYTGVEDHLHDYVNGGNLSWATMNVGATSTDRSSPDSYGLYFAWGETTGHKWNTTAGNGKFEPINGDTSYSFTWENAFWGEELADETLNELCPWVENPYNTSQSYRTLSLKYDAAYQNWGGAWRMPRSFDFVGLQGVTWQWANYKASSERGEIDFANVGYGNGTTRTVPNDSDCRSSYWTSTLTNDTKIANYLNVYSSVGTGNTANQFYPYGYRYIGHAVRPVVANDGQ